MLRKSRFVHFVDCVHLASLVRFAEKSCSVLPGKFRYSHLLVLLTLFALHATAPALSLVTPAVAAEKQSCAFVPNEQLQAQTVVSIVLEALRTNQAGDAGIAQVFCFASPANKVVTGPVERFATMIHRGFSDMLNHSLSEVEPIEVNGDQAEQRVWLETAGGTVVGYLFQLGKQTSGEFKGMWMTEAVYPLDPAERRQSI